jgi:hypothetical protein
LDLVAGAAVTGGRYELFADTGDVGDGPLRGLATVG